MITFLKKRKHSRTARLLEYFKKPTIRIIDDASADIAYASADIASADIADASADIADASADIASIVTDAVDVVTDIADVAVDVSSDVAAAAANLASNDDDDDDDMMSINMSKISSITNKFKGKKGDLKKSIMTNASIVKELLIKTIDKHKIDMCTQMASQLVEVYNKKHSIPSSNEEIEISTNT
jgi:hypothetical protein